MLTSALNYDFICYPLKAQYFDHLDSTLKSEIEKIFSNIEKGLIADQEIKSFANSQIKNLFNLRIKAIKWFLEDNHIGDLGQTIEECYHDFDSLNKNSRLIFFVENLKFALRSNKRLIEAFGEHTEAINPNEIESEFKKTSFLEITYDQFITSIALGIPDEEAAQRIIDLVGASLLIEFSAISAGILVDKKIDISEEKAIQLTSLVGNAAQEYSAICYELGLLKRHKSGHPVMQFDNYFIEEQQYLADLGLEDLVEN
jgi:hypothetical protein